MDHARNVELSWRYLHWARRARDVDEDMIIGEFINSCNRTRAAERTTPRKKMTTREERLLAHGKLPVALRTELVARSWDETIMPRLRAFLSRTAVESTDHSTKELVPHRELPSTGSCG